MEGNAKQKYLYILGAVVAVALLGAAAWGIGWGARSLFERRAASPVTQTPAPTRTMPATVEPTKTSAPAELAPTATPSSAPTRLLRPTSTPASTLAPTPTPAFEVVRAGEGLYQVCRRHCPGQWPGREVPPELEAYARQVARANGLRWGLWGPRLSGGQKLRMPSCP
jgi:hypothetical protein